MAQNNILQNDIVYGHRTRMLNLKKYYPFFRLSEISFEGFRQGRYGTLDMGYIVMAVLRFFIEENNFKEKDVTYPEYVEFIGRCVRRDFALEVTDEECRDIAGFIFDKIKNEGRPFEFGYYDPADRKHKISRMKLIDSTIRDNTVLYSITAEAVEFYLDTKEIKDESRISVQQLLLEKMIRAQNFGKGAEVVENINAEVERLMLRRREVEQLLAADVSAGLEAYRDFTDNGMRWFDDEQRLFVKNRELIDAAIARMENTPAHTEGFAGAVSQIYELDNQLKLAMSRHGELLRACIQLQKLSDEAIRRGKLSRLRVHCDYRQLLNQMIKNENTALLELMVHAMLKPNMPKLFALEAIDECLTQRTQRSDIIEKAGGAESGDIVFADELEEQRISHNYGLFMKIIVQALEQRSEITSEQLNEYIKDRYREKADRILKNADYYSFLVHLCHKSRYVIGGEPEGEEGFLDEILEHETAGCERTVIAVEPRAGGIRFSLANEAADGSKGE